MKRIVPLTRMTFGVLTLAVIALIAAITVIVDAIEQRFGRTVELLTLVGLFAPLLTYLLTSHFEFLAVQAGVDQGADPIFGVTREGQLRYANGAAERLLGKRLSELRQLSIWDVSTIGQSDWPGHWQSVEQAGLLRVEATLLIRDGGRLEGEFAFSRLRALGFESQSGVFHDLTDRKRLEAGLRRSEEHFRQLFESNPVPMWVFSPETLRFLAVNDAAVATYGYSAEEFLAMKVTDIRPPEDVSRFMAQLRDLPEREVHRAGTWFHRRKDGSLIEASVTTHRTNFEGRAARFVMAVDVTEQRGAERELRASEARLKESQRLASLGSWEVDLRTGEIIWSDETHRLFGLSPEASPSGLEAAMAGVHPDDRPLNQRWVEAALAGERPGPIEFRIVRPDGSVRHVLGQGHIVLGDDGRAVSLVGTLLDITERWHAEQGLRESEARHRAITESASVAIITANAEGRVTDWNRAATALFGYEPGEILGQPVERLMPDRHRALYLSRMQDVLRDTGPDGGGQWELTGLRRDGSEFPLELSLARWELGGQPFVSAIIADVTQRRAAEASLRLQSAALEAAANAIVIADRDARIVWVNSAFTTLTGYTAEEAIGQNPRMLKSGAHDQEFYRELWTTLRAGRVWQGEITNRRKDGTLYPEEMTITPVLSPAGEITHYIAIKRDLTQERALRSQLVQAQKMEAIGRLTGGIAHDFNNILMAITGYADFLLDGVREHPQLAQDALEVRKAADRAATLTRQLLAFSRRQVLTPQVLDLNAVITDLSKMLGRLLGEDVMLRTRLAPDLGTVRADPGQMEQVILNLAINARDAMPAGGPLEIGTENLELDQHYIELHPYVQPGAYVMLWVTDGGIGIAREHLPHIFEPYFTTKGQGKGTGLGLSTVFGIVKQSGGHVEVYSEPGLGSTFKIYLPRHRAETAAPVVTAAPSSRGGSETILVVDDAPAIGRLVERILAGHGYRVLLATGPAEALELAKGERGRIDLLLTDVVMPERRGTELAAELVRLRPDLRVIYMSGYLGDVSAHKELLDRGALMLAKPVPVATLLARVREVLDGVHSGIA